jgi:hypothetical protein
MAGDEMRGVDWEDRLWSLTQLVAARMAGNPRGVVPREDAKVAVCFAAWVVSEYMESRKPPRPTAEEIIRQLEPLK